jgi:hypothetical protein
MRDRGWPPAGRQRSAKPSLRQDPRQYQAVGSSEPLLNEDFLHFGFGQITKIDLVVHDRSVVEALLWSRNSARWHTALSSALHRLGCGTCRAPCYGCSKSLTGRSTRNGYANAATGPPSKPIRGCSHARWSRSTSGMQAPGEARNGCTLYGRRDCRTGRSRRNSNGYGGSSTAARGSSASHPVRPVALVSNWCQKDGASRPVLTFYQQISTFCGAKAPPGRLSVSMRSPGLPVTFVGARRGSLWV